MATHPTNAPPLPHLESLADHNFNHSNDAIDSITQVSFNDLNDSCPTTSNSCTFSCQINTNITGCQLFPLVVIPTTNYKQKISIHNLLNYLRSQQIVNNIKIFKDVKCQQNFSLNDTQQFPLKETQKQQNKFPSKNNWKNDLKYQLNYAVQKKEITLKTINYSRKIKFEVLKRNRRNHLYAKKYTKTFKCKSFQRVKNNFKKIHKKTKSWTKLFCRRIKIFKLKANKNHLNPLVINKTRTMQIPFEILKTEKKFPAVNKFHNEINTKLLNFNQIFDFSNKIYENDSKNSISITKFPCQFQNVGGVMKFPINNKVFHNKHSFNNDLNKYLKLNNSKNPKITNYLTTFSMLQNVQNMKYFDNEHVLQVQEAQIEAMENPRSFTITESKKKTPPQTATFEKSHDENIHKLADTNSINNSHLIEVGYYAEKIEYLQDAIVSLFEKIKNSLITNHKNDHGSSKNATKPDDRFASTPPMSVTSVQNAESINNENKEFPYEKFDLGDLCVGHDHKLECSDVRDTLTEAVDSGNRKEQIKSTGNILVNSEEPISPYTPPPPKPINETDNTSLAHKSNIRELLLPINCNFEENFKFNSNQIINTEINIENDKSETGFKTLASNLPETTTNEMTVTRSNKNEQEKISQIKTKQNKGIEHKNSNLINTQDSNEMKFEMHKIKGALPNSGAERNNTSKHDNLNITGTKQVLPTTNSSARNYNDNSYTLRTQLQNEKPKNMAAGRYPSQLSDNTRIRSTDLNNISTKRAGLNSSKNFSTSNTEQTPQKPSSLGALHQTQSTYQLSVDLPRYTPLANTKQTDKTILNSRAASVDSSLSDVLPERTRLRRQRRLRSQESQEESEDAVERLNRLRARISASLSEVKGVLKQYTTEPENGNENENKISSALPSVKETNEEEKKEGPVVFRFVKKVRRRSLFTEDEENQQMETEIKKDLSPKKSMQEIQLKNTNETDHCKPEKEKILCSEKSDKNEGQKLETKKDNKAGLLEITEIQLETDISTLKKEALETGENKDETDHSKLETETDLKTDNSKTHKEQFEAKVQTLKENGLELETKLVANDTKNTKDQELKGAIPKSIISSEQTKLENDSAGTHKKLKKKIIIKAKAAIRRASLAAVEGSKIEPAVKLAIPNKIERRPSDSEAVVKKKILTAKLNTSGVVEEVTPKPKIVKIKKSSLQTNSNDNNNSNSTQLATIQTKRQEEHFVELPPTNEQNDDHTKSLNKDKQSIVSDKNQDVLVPKLADLERQQQQQLKNDITSQRNSWLPMKSVIDEVTASLNEKTLNENSVLTPKQQNDQHQYQNQQEQNQKATIKSTATKFLSHGLQAKDNVMLENVTTVISSSTASQANGQKTHANIVVQPTDYHDLLQTEIALNKSPTPNNTSKLQLSNKVESLQDDKSHENLDKSQIATKEQQKGQATIQNQQVLKTTEVTNIKNDDNNNNNNSQHEDLKATATLKQPCNVEIVKQQQQQHHQRSDEQSATNDTKTISSPHNSISCLTDIAPQTTAETALLLSTESGEEKKAENTSANQQTKMPELQLAPAPVQTADIISQPEHHKKKIIIKKIIRPTSSLDVDKTTKTTIAQEIKSPQETKTETQTQTQTNELKSDSNHQELLPKSQNILNEATSLKEPTKEPTIETESLQSQEAEISESSISQDSEEVSASLPTTKKERIVKKKVIIKRQKRRLSIGENFFHLGSSDDQTQNNEIETLEKPIAFVSDDEAEQSDDKDEEAQIESEHEEEKKPLRSCILRKEYNIGDEVLYAERFKKTQIKWRRGRIKERITSISYLLDIDGKDVSSHINYLKKFTGRKVSFGGKEYLEIDYEQLAEEEEKAERLKKRSYSIWNMV